VRSKYKALLVVFVASSQLAGCETDYTVVQSSSQEGVDYAEEPLTEWSSKYSTALETSNRFIEAFSAGVPGDIRILLDYRLDEDVSDEDLLGLRDKILATYGPIVEYKPSQWGFAVGPTDDQYMFSVKIVVHEKQQVFYIFRFEANSEYDKLMGFTFRGRASGLRLSDVAKIALDQSRDPQ